LTGTLTLGDYYDLYGGNSLAGLGFGANAPASESPPQSSDINMMTGAGIKNIEVGSGSTPNIDIN
jgi:hypothetical protein